MIHVDESDPVGENESPFAARTVKIARGINPEGKYELIRELGRGKFGTVYRCREKTTNLELAAKFVGIPNRGDRRNVEREVDIMNTLQHHLITQLYDAFEYKKMMCVVLELIEGGELFDRVIGDDFVLTERACTVFVRQICEALEFVHRNLILHLDLKPENIMCLTREGNRIKIIDFGLARKFDPEKKMQILFGTPEFVAPEVVNFDAIGFSTDMWSVGVICYVLLSGLSPFMGETDVETMGNVTVAKYDFDDEAFNEISEEALNFITHLLVKEPEKRMTASESLHHPWLLRRQPKRTISKSSLDMQHVQLISDLSPPKDDLDLATLPTVRSESTCRTKADCDDSEEEVLPPAPPLPKTAPPPIELLIESSLPIIIPTMTAPAISEQSFPDSCLSRGESAITEPADDIDKELELTKDNLKSFVERWDGSQPVQIPNSSGATATPQPKKLSSQSYTTDNSDARESSDFITPWRDGNDEASPSDKQGQLPGKTASADEETQRRNNKTTEENQEITIGDVAQPESPNNNTRKLLEQLEQIEILSTPKEQTEKTVNGVNYLQVVNNLGSSTTSSALSSRGCSPSPCESLTSNDDTQEQQASTSMEECGNIGSPAGPLRDYLQSFDRRKSDSNCVLRPENSPSNKEEQLDLKAEIKRLSDHLVMLNTLKTELVDKESESKEEHEFVPSRAPSARKSSIPNLVTNGTAVQNGSSEKRRQRSKQSDATNLNSKLESKIVKSQIMRFSRGDATETSCTNKVASSGQNTCSMTGQYTSSFSSVRTATRLIEEQHKPQTPTSQPPWMFKCARTKKFRMTELSRDVPQSAPDSHKTVFIEEAATNTKDCLLQLLDKYNHHGDDELINRSSDIHSYMIPSSSSSSSSSIASLPPARRISKISKTQSSTNTVKTTARTMITASSSCSSATSTWTKTSTRSEKKIGNAVMDSDLEAKTGPGHTEFAKSIPRHFSLSLNWDKEGLEETTMNSLNAFFQRHSSNVGNSAVKQIQQQIEGSK